MPINTKNAAGIVGAAASDKTKRRVTFKKQTYVSSLGRNSAVGETQYVSDADARFLIAYKYAVKAEQEPVASAMGITLTGADNKESSSSSQVGSLGSIASIETVDDETESTGEAEEPQRYFGRGRGRRRGSE